MTQTELDYLDYCEGKAEINEEPLDFESWLELEGQCQIQWLADTAIITTFKNKN